MYILFTVCILCFPSALYAKKKKHVIPELIVSVPMLEEMEDIAITFGEGKNVMYVFVDPFCRYSRDFITKVTSSPKMLKSYTYKIFLLKLKKFESMETIRYIYDSVDPYATLVDVMVKKNKIPADSHIEDKDIEDTIARIKNADKVLDIYKRPYLIIANKNWKEEWEEDHDWD